jgi:hypothetical protein
MMKSIYFIDEITLFNLFAQVLPGVMRAKPKPTFCYVIDGSKAAVYVAGLMGKMLGFTVKRMDFKLADMRDENGIAVRLKVAYGDLAEIQKSIINDPSYSKLTAGIDKNSRLPWFLSKSLAAIEFEGPGVRRHIWNAMLVIQAVKNQGVKCEKKVLFLKRRKWFKHLRGYAEQNGVELVALGSRKGWDRRLLLYLRKTLATTFIGKAKGTDRKTEENDPRMAVEYYGHLNLDNPERFSDLFFMQQSDLRGKDILLMFKIPCDPLDGRKLEALNKKDIKPLLLSPRAARLAGVPLFRHESRMEILKALKLMMEARFSDHEVKWANEQVFAYEWLRSYWTELFKKNGVKLFVHWFKYDATHMAIADALESLGGVTAIYQRAYESHPSPEATVAADIGFAFSHDSVLLEERNGSRIKYQVIVGYPGDYRFPLLKQQAQNIRRSLEKNGARRILAFLDENTVDDPRWFTGHEFTKRNYIFLLEKLLQNPWMGLVIKPKSPRNLRQRLGEVSTLLEKALATGRCYLFEGGAVQCSYSPAAAALASDLTIHEVLSAATAGMESALAGVPTVLMDLEGWAVSPLYELGVGKVVFTDWQSLWEAIEKRFPELGDWSPLLADLDPFRDGKAAERIGTYLKWMLDGFKTGSDRETVMAEAAERYAKIWGSDKITERMG